MRHRPSTNYKRPAIIGLLALVVLAGGGLAWASYAKIASAVVASGSVVVEGKPKSVQHLDGGIVRKLYVSPGDKVTKNQILVRLDDTSVAANLAIYERRLREAIVRKERLNAELNSVDSFAPPTVLATLMKLGDLESSMASQMALLQARRATRQGQLAQFDEKISQFKNQIVGVKGLRKQKNKQVVAYDEEIEAVGGLVAQKLASNSQLLNLTRAQAELRGQIAEHGSEIARLKNSIIETRISKLQVDREFRERVISELEKTETQIDEMRQQMEATRKQLNRVAVRAPVPGIVHEMNLFTIGGVVQPGQTIMQIIPQTGEHDIELNIDPQSIDQISVGQKAIIRFPAFHQRTTPELDGKISIISPSSVVDEKTGVAFYRAAVEISDSELKKLGAKKLVPGMPVEAFFPTNERTVLSYLLKPLLDNLKHAFREE